MPSKLRAFVIIRIANRKRGPDNRAAESDKENDANPEQQIEPAHGGLALMREDAAGAENSGVDLVFATRLARGFVKRMSNPKLHQQPRFASGPLILTFAKVPAEVGCEC
jgi:hypothetical protein